MTICSAANGAFVVDLAIGGYSELATAAGLELAQAWPQVAEQVAEQVPRQVRAQVIAQVE